MFYGNNGSCFWIIIILILLFACGGSCGGNWNSCTCNNCETNCTPCC